MNSRKLKPVGAVSNPWAFESYHPSVQILFKPALVADKCDWGFFEHNELDPDQCAHVLLLTLLTHSKFVLQMLHDWFQIRKTVLQKSCIESLECYLKVEDNGFRP